jgi:hypothetical protein
MTIMAEWERSEIKVENDRITVKYDLAGKHSSCSNCGLGYATQDGVLMENAPYLSFLCFTCFKNEPNCGACGQFFPLSEADKEGFHSDNSCDASEGQD